jgi:hypothetical protein
LAPHCWRDEADDEPTREGGADVNYDRWKLATPPEYAECIAGEGLCDCPECSRLLNAAARAYGVASRRDEPTDNDLRDEIEF